MASKVISMKMKVYEWADYYELATRVQVALLQCQMYLL